MFRFDHDYRFDIAKELGMDIIRDAQDLQKFLDLVPSEDPSKRDEQDMKQKGFKAMG